MTGCQGHWKSKHLKARTPEDGKGLAGLWAWDPAVVGLYLVVPVCDSPQAKGSWCFATSPGLKRWDCLLHLQICKWMYVLTNGMNDLCFWLMGHQLHSCWAVIDFPTQLLQLCHRCSLSEVRGLVVWAMEKILTVVIPEKSAIVMANSH